MPGVRITNYGACEFVNGRLVFHSEPTVVEWNNETERDLLLEEKRRERVERVAKVRRQLTDSRQKKK